MVHCITGFVARWRRIDAADPALAGAVVAPLPQGFGLLVIGEETAELDGGPDPRLAPLGPGLSVGNGDVALVATNYFGGLGVQGACAWRDGALVEPYREAPAGAINAALRAVGVDRGSAHDEFDAIGLGRFRRNDGWIAFARAAAARGGA